MSYTIEILRSAQKQLAKINRQDQATIFSAIRNLADTPGPIGCKKLSGRPAWRLRIAITGSSTRYMMIDYSSWS